MPGARCTRSRANTGARFVVSAACFRIDGGSRNSNREIQWIGWVEPLRNPSQKLQWMGIAELIIGRAFATRWFHLSCALA
jgi:hypothetical protein